MFRNSKVQIPYYIESDQFLLHNNSNRAFFRYSLTLYIWKYLHILNVMIIKFVANDEICS